VDQLGPSALGEVLEPGRVRDCYLGLLLPPGPAGELEAGTVLIVAPAALLHPRVPQPAGSLVYELLSGHPEREAGELVFVADLTGELRARPHDTWAKVGVDPDQVAQAVVGCWRDGEVIGLRIDDLGFEEARSLTRPAMTDVCGQLRGRLTARLGRIQRRWLHPTSGRRPGSCSRPHPAGGHRTRPSVRGVRNLDGIPDGHSGGVRQRLGQDRSGSARAAGVAMPAGHRPCFPEGAVACGSSGPGPRPAVLHELPSPRWLPQGPPVSMRGGRRAVGGRTSVRASDRRRHQDGHRSQLPRVADTSRPERRSFRKQRTANPPIARYKFLYSSSRPACGRRPSSAGRPQPRALLPR
jgi:hypothetical protein